MIVIDACIRDPFFNIAVEEYLFRQFNDDIFLVYINDRSIIIGKHQNPFEEINISFVRENNIPVIRRISGGGSVYHDKGNLNFSFMKNREDGKRHDFLDFINPLIDFFSGKGIETLPGDKNEIRVDGFKFSGNAEHIFRNRVLHHGTILFSSNISEMKTALKKGRAKIESRAVSSNRTNVCNIGEYMAGVSDVGRLKNELVDYISSLYPGSEKYILNDKDISAVKQLIDDKFSTWEWNYAYGPRYSFISYPEIPGGPDRIELLIKDGLINKCIIDGDEPWLKLNRDLTGKKHRYEEIKNELLKNELPSANEFVYLFLM